MRRRGIGVEGVASEIGALADGGFSIKRDALIKGLRSRFNSTEEEAEQAILIASQIGAVLVTNNMVSIKR